MSKAEFIGKYNITVEYKSGKRHSHLAVTIEPIPGGFRIGTPEGKFFDVKPHTWKHFEYRPCHKEGTSLTAQVKGEPHSSSQ